MIKRLFTQVVEAISSSESDVTENRESALRLATAVLMIDVARADAVFDESEFDKVLTLAEKHFGLSPEDAMGPAVASSGVRPNIMMSPTTWGAP